MPVSGITEIQAQVYLTVKASLVAQLVKDLPAMWETWVQSLDWEDPLEEEKATHSRILPWSIPWTIKSIGSQRVDMTERLSLHYLTVKLLLFQMHDVFAVAIVSSILFKQHVTCLPFHVIYMVFFFFFQDKFILQPAMFCKV